MRHQVLVLAEAEEDIFDIYKYVVRSNGRRRADHVLPKLDGNASPRTQPT